MSVKTIHVFPCVQLAEYAGKLHFTRDSEERAVIASHKMASQKMRGLRPDTVYIYNADHPGWPPGECRTVHEVAHSIIADGGRVVYKYV